MLAGYCGSLADAVGAGDPFMSGLVHALWNLFLASIPRLAPNRALAATCRYPGPQRFVRIVFLDVLDIENGKPASTVVCQGRGAIKRARVDPDSDHRRHL